MKTPSIKQQLKHIEDKLASDNTCDIFDEKQLNEITRARIGRIFVWGFFIALVGSIVFVVAYNLIIFSLTKQIELFLNLESIIPLVWSVIWTPLWFVMGYYFKNNGD